MSEEGYSFSQIFKFFSELKQSKAIQDFSITKAGLEQILKFYSL